MLSIFSCCISSLVHDGICADSCCYDSQDLVAVAVPPVGHAMSRCHKITLAGRIADIVPDLTAVVSAHGAISEFFGFQSGTADTECRPVVEVDPSIFTRGTEANTVAHAIGAVFLNHIFPPGQEGDTDAKSVVFIGDTVCCGAIYDVKACIIGFLIYWILSIKSRTLQFGILRAMGMKFREIIMMIVYEQLLVSGVAIFTAIFIGGVTSDLFVPLFQSIFDASQSVPPFAVIPERSDYLKLYAVIGVMLLTAFVVLGRLIKKIKISQALKLGED